MNEEDLLANPVKRKLAIATLRIHRQQMDLIGKMLTDFGVPEWVTVENTPGNSAIQRLKWLLIRRKAIKKSECGGDTWETDKDFLSQKT